ncbi:Dehydrogenase [Penicillium chermesinum]|uniref:Dehydrogenase n=1 Tax=Penicillium chermesinum TaxID=63820 RepID=A0A9W9U0B7_9EURO|nr:Dehydrogenase [Penicillium chermesinum]KAJ5248856.1 Dehydrogenase [Penicillium chermesinum]
MSTQTALAITEVGKPLVKLDLSTHKGTELKDAEVLVKVTAAGREFTPLAKLPPPTSLTIPVAPLDQKMRDFGRLGIGERLPWVLSGDIVGEVIEGGPQNKFPLGTHIFSQMIFQLPQSGGLQEYTILNSEYAAEVPKTIPDTEAALYPINIVTAAISLFSEKGFGFPLPETPEAQGFDYASQKVAIIGGVSGGGTIIVTASPSSTELLKSFGATHVISRHDSDVEEQVRAIVGDELLYVYDTFNFGSLDLAASLLSNSKRGTLKKAGFEEKRTLGFSNLIPAFGKALWTKLPEWLANGKIKPLEYKTIDGLDADKVNAALDEYAAGRSGVRYHVRV